MSKIKKLINYFKTNGILTTFAKLYEYKMYKSFAKKYMTENLCTQEELEAQKNTDFKHKTLFSIIIPAYNPNKAFFEETIKSVLNQTYSNWELIIADGSDFKNKTGEETALAFSLKDNRIHYIRIGGNLGISGNTNMGADKCKGSYIAFLDHDDILLPNALFAAAEAVGSADADFLYSDEFTFETNPSAPTHVTLKPNFGEYTLRGINYIGHLSIVKKSIFNSIGGLRTEFDGSQDYDLALRICEVTQNIYHIPQVLYGWRIHGGSTASGIEAKQYCLESAKKAIDEHLKNMGADAKISDAEGAPTAYRLTYKPYNGSLSIIVCFNGSERSYRSQMETIAAVTEEKNVEIISVGGYNCFNDVININYDDEYNFSAMANLGADEAQGNILLFLDGSLLLKENSVEELSSLAALSDVGAVGGVIVNRAGFVEEAGAYLTSDGFAPALKGAPSKGTGYLRFLKIHHNTQAMTGRFLMIKRMDFYSSGCFNENLNTDEAGFELCQILEELGKNNLINPYAKAVSMK